MATLDKYALVLSKSESQTAFRFQVARAALRVDVSPTLEGVQQFAETLTAEVMLPLVEVLGTSLPLSDQGEGC